MKLSLCVMILLVVGSAMAAPFPINFTLTAFNNGQWQLGYPYTATIGPFVGIPVMCDDYVHGGLPGDTWRTFATSLGSTDYSDLRFFTGTLSSANLYREAGWLLMQTGANPTQLTGINQVVWYLFDPNFTLTDPNAAKWLALGLAERLAGFPGVSFTQLLVFTPVFRLDPDPTHPQEMMYFGADFGTLGTGNANVLSTPEPGTLALLAGGLLGVWGRWKLA